MLPKNCGCLIKGVDPASDAIGGGEASVQRLAEDAGVSQRAYLTGQVGSVADWYTRADLFLLSSRYEGFPNVLPEAMASGCPCVAFDCDTGPRDLIEDGVNRLLVSAECVEALTNSMVRLTRNVELRAVLGSRAVALRQAFSEQGVMALWQRVLR